MVGKVILPVLIGIVVLGLIGFSDAHAVLAIDPPTILDISARDHSIAIGTDDFPVVAYSGSHNLKLIHCTTVNCSANDAPITLDSAVVSGWYTSIAIGTDTFPVISYTDINRVDLKLVHCTTVDCSANDTPITLDSVGDVGENTSIAIGTDGFPIISYRDRTNSNLKLVHCTTVDCSANDTPITLDSTTFTGTDNSIAIGSDGFPVISYNLSSEGGQLRLIHCTTLDCSGEPVPVILDNGAVAWFNSIAIGSDNFPVISYYEPGVSFSLRDLKLVHCTTVDCSANDTPITLDSVDDVGRYSSIAIGTDGFPVVTYHDNTNKNLKLVHCTRVDCSANDTPIILDPTSVQKETSVAIGTDGFPVVGYLGGQLTLVHCLTVNCEEDILSTLILAPSAQSPGKTVTIIVTEVPDGTPVNIELNGINILTGTAGTFNEFFKSVIIPITTTAGEGVITAKWTVGTDNFMLSEPFTVLPLPVVDFTNQGTFTTEQISESGVTITGSNTLNIKSISGLGVVGGEFDNFIDGDESVTFAFDSPALDVFYFVAISFNVDLDQFNGETIIEAFDSNENSLGTQQITSLSTIGSSTIPVSSLYGDVLISKFIVTADPDAIIIGSLTFILDFDGDGVADIDDICPGFDDNIDTDSDGIPDGCDTLTVEQQIGDLKDQINGILVDKDAKKLTKKLDKTNEKLTPQPEKANKDLDKFLDKVEKLFVENKLTLDERNSLITALDSIRTDPTDDSITIEEIQTVLDAVNAISNPLLTLKDTESLTKPLNKAIDDLTPNVEKACKEMDKFIKDTNKLVTKGKLLQVDADKLIESAQKIKTDIGCV